MNTQKFSFAVVCALALLPTFAQAQDAKIGTNTTAQVIDSSSRFETEFTLPNAIDTIMQLDGQAGLAFATSDGRFFVRGVMIEISTGEMINTLAEYREVLGRYYEDQEDYVLPDIHRLNAGPFVGRQMRLPSQIRTVADIQGAMGLLFLTGDGRFGVNGSAFDMWEGAEIASVARLREAAGTIDLNKLSGSSEALDPMSYGFGDSEVLLFVDPHCPFCAALFEQILANSIYAEEFTFRIFTVPYLAEASATTVRALSCHPDREAATRALMSKDERWIKAAEGQLASEEFPLCNEQAIIERLLLSQKLGIRGVPYLVGPRGGAYAGLPPDLLAFLLDS